MENEKVKKKKRGIRLTAEERKTIYKEEKQKYITKNFNEMLERTFVIFGNILLPLYIIFSSMIIGIATTLYIVVRSTSEIREAFISNPFGVSVDLAIVSIMAFTFFAVIGFLCFSLYLKSDDLLREKPELKKKLTIFNWRK